MLEPEPKAECSVRLAELTDASDAGAVLGLLEHYALHPMGRGGPLPLEVKETVIEGLRQHPTTRVFLAEVDSVAVGLAICFVGFSTFQAMPLMNIHDLVVHAASRGQGIGGALVDAVTSYARQRAWCAVTLEVRSDSPARRLYASKGFRQLADPCQGSTMLFGKLQLSPPDELS